MSLNAWIGLVTVLVPALALLGIAAAVRIGLWVMDERVSAASVPC